MIPGFQQGEYEAASPLIAAQQSVNQYPEIYQAPGEPGKLVFRGVPGTIARGDYTDIRGLHIAWGVLYIVAGSYLYEYGGSRIGNVRGTGPVSMTHNINELLVVSSGKGYTVQRGTTDFAQVTDSEFPSAVVADFLDGYGLLVEKDSGRFWFTEINDFESISGIDFATAEGAPDDLVTLIADHREIWLFGQETTEIWFNTGNATNPFKRQRFVERGCKGVHGPAKADNTVFWLGEDGIVYRADEYTPSRISNHGIEHVIGETTTDPIGYTYSQDGHVFYALNFPNELSVVYDAATGLWHRRKARNRMDAAYHHAVSLNGQVFVGGDRLYTLDPKTYTHAGDEIERIRTVGPLRSPRRWTPLPSVTALFETGVTPLSESRAFLQVSDDGGRTFGHRFEASLGGQGRNREEVRFHGLGGFYDGETVLRLTVTDNARHTLVDMDVP